MSIDNNYSSPKKMKKVGDLFDKYRTKIKAPQASVEKVSIEVIKKLTDFDVEVKQVSYTVSTKTLFLKLPSILKSELKFYHKDILKELEGILGKQESPKNIL